MEYGQPDISSQIATESSLPPAATVTPESKNVKDLEKLATYRDGLKDGISDGEKDYQTTITYLAAGALAFFLTINDKFFHLTETRYQFILWLSLVFLLLTLLLLLICSILDIKSNEAIRDGADKMYDKKYYDKDELTAIWKKWMWRIRLSFYIRFGLLILGIAMEVLFVCLNSPVLKAQLQPEHPPAVTIEIQSISDSMNIKVDTSNKRTILSIIHKPK